MSATFSFQIFVRTLSGNTIALDVQPTDTIATVKANVLRKDRPGTPTEPQAVRLAFGSKQLHDTRSLGEYGIDRDCTLDVSGRLLGGMRLYHCTSKSNAAAIKRNGFRCGSSGLAGGGIYFAESVDDASRKARHQGVVLECEVNLGRMRHIGFSGEDDLTLSRLNSAGYDSVCIPRNGTEYCVYESSRVRVVGEHRDTRASSPVNPIVAFFKSAGPDPRTGRPLSRSDEPPPMYRYKDPLMAAFESAGLDPRTGRPLSRSEPPAPPSPATPVTPKKEKKSWWSRFL